MQIGDAIIESILAFGSAIQAEAQRREKINHLRMCASTIRCGNCGNWMKKRTCPREAKGIVVGMNALSCRDFIADQLTLRAQADLRAILDKEAPHD